jgi:hypothetical protein
LRWRAVARITAGLVVAAAVLGAVPASAAVVKAACVYQPVARISATITTDATWTPGCAGGWPGPQFSAMHGESVSSDHPNAPRLAASAGTGSVSASDIASPSLVSTNSSFRLSQQLQADPQWTQPDLASGRRYRQLLGWGWRSLHERHWPEITTTFASQEAGYKGRLRGRQREPFRLAWVLL